MNDEAWLKEVLADASAAQQLAVGRVELPASGEKRRGTAAIQDASRERVISDTPEYWLGRLASIAALEQAGQLTVRKAVLGLRQTIKQMHQIDDRKRLRQALH